MKKKIFSLLMLLFVLSGLTQNNIDSGLDSLLALLKNCGENTLKVDLLNKITLKYWEKESGNRKDSVGFYSDKATKLARRLKYSKGLAEALLNQGKFHIASTHSYAISTPCFLESLSVFVSLDDSLGISKCYLQLGLTSYILQYYEDAIKNFKLSLTYSDNATSNYLMALSYSELEIFPEAKKYFSKSINAYKKRNNQIRLNECYMYLGKLYSKMHQHDSAFYYLNKAIDQLKVKNELSYLSRPYAFVSAVYLQANNIEKAIYYAQLSFNMSSTSSDEISFVEATATLSKAYARKGNFKKAYYYLDLLSTTKDTFFKGSTKQKVADMQSMFDFKRKINDQKISQIKDKEIALQQIQKERILRNSFLIGSALLLLLLIVLYSRYKIKQNANIALEGKNKIISEEKERSENLLLNILPFEVAEELKLKGSADAKLIDEVTVLFTDFKGFTIVSEKLSPKELVKDIHECFSAFDLIMEKHGLEKIKTIGDSYMAAGGLPNPNTTHATDAICAAFEILRFIETGKANKIAMGAPFFEVRIGIHTGPVVAGIVGVKKFAYDIWGDTVNVASRMESGGEEGKVNISETTYDLVKDKFNCTYRGKIQAKNKGMIDMYFVESNFSG